MVILDDDFRTRFCIQPLAWFNSGYSSCAKRFRCAEVLFYSKTYELPVFTQEHADSQGFKVDTTSLRSQLVLVLVFVAEGDPFCARCPGFMS